MSNMIKTPDVVTEGGRGGDIMNRNNSTLPQMRTIRVAKAYCDEHEVGISERFIRQLVKDGKIPAVMAGKTALLDLNALLEFLGTNRVSESLEMDAQSLGVLRRVDDRVSRL